jgi:glycosyltransferase involved in cell wall biosynthesis
MKILHITTIDRGGAAIACLRLHEGLLAVGIDSNVLVLEKEKDDIPHVYAYQPDVVVKKPFDQIKRKIQQVLKKMKLYENPYDRLESEQQKIAASRLPELELVSFPYSTIDITNNKWFKEADLVHLHWVANFLDYRTFFKKCDKPIVWTFHDMNSFLGGEHYNETLLGPDEQGIPIPRQFTEQEQKIEEKLKKIKKKVFENAPVIHIVAPSNWMANELRDSLMFNNYTLNIIPYGIDPTEYKLLDKGYSRGILNIPLDKKVILFVANSLANNRKGFKYLQLSLNYFQREDVVMCSIGQNPTTDSDIEINNIEMGEIQDQKMMNIAYSAADLYVIPSLMDNLPNTVLESLLCGTPVISFPIGGLPDMINNEKNGYIADEISVNALTRSLTQFFNDGVKWSTEEIRKDAIERFGTSIQNKRILQLYESIIKD